MIKVKGFRPSANSTDSIGWTSNSSDGANSLEEDHYLPDNHQRSSGQPTDL